MNPESERRSEIIANVGCLALSLFMAGWCLVFFYLPSEPSFAAFLLGVPLFILTPVVSISLMVLLWRSRSQSLAHSAAFYGSICFLLAFASLLVAGAIE